MTSTAARPAASGSAPRGGQLPGLPAGIASRVVANVLDAVLLVVLLVVSYAGFAVVRFLRRPREFSFPAPSLVTVATIACAVCALYFAICWAATGRTYGDVVLGLRVVSSTRGRVHPVVAVLRAVLCVAVPIGLLWSGVSRSRHSIQDLIVRTTVVYDWPDGVPTTPPGGR